MIEWNYPALTPRWLLIRATPRREEQVSRPEKSWWRHGMEKRSSSPFLKPYHKISITSRTKSQNVSVSRLVS